MSDVVLRAMARNALRHPDAKPRVGYAVAPLLSAGHAPDCQFRIAETCAIPVECEHGHDCCPICDPCTCGKNATSNEVEDLPHTAASIPATGADRDG